MARAAMKNGEPVNVQLTIVPTDFDEADPSTADDLLLEAPLPAYRRPAAAPRVVAPVVAPEPVAPVAAAPKVAAAPSPKPAPARAARTPAPAPARTGLIVASALGGGVVLGGGAVGVAGILAAVLAAGATLVGGGVALWLVSSSGVESAVDEIPVAVEAPIADPTATPVAETPAAPAKDPVGTTPSKPAAGAPTSGTPSAPVETPASAPVATTPAAPAAPVGPVTVKIITDPPAASIVIDGQDMGRSPAKLELPPGSHQLTLSSGKVTGSFPFDASAGKLCFSVQGKKISQVACN